MPGSEVARWPQDTAKMVTLAFLATASLTLETTLHVADLEADLVRPWMGRP